MWTTHLFMLAAASGLGYGAASGAPETEPLGSGPHQNGNETPPADAYAVVAFWKEAGPAAWFAKNPAFDQRFREQFARSYEAAAQGQLDAWLGSAEGALALCLLLDQYPRNSFRGTPRMYATDERARRLADAAIRAGHDLTVEPELSLFFYLPFGHSEQLDDQERAVRLAERLGEKTLRNARRHRDIVQQFGRFPHRNPILGRRMTPAEQRFLDAGGYSG